MLNDVKVHDQDTEQRADKRPQHVEGVVDQLRRVKQVPRRQQNRSHGGNHPAGAEADFLRRAVREIERRGDKVGHDINPDGGGDHGQQANGDRQVVTHAAHGLNRVGDHAAKQRLRAGDNHHGHDGEQQEVKRQAPAVAAADLTHAFAVAREIAKVEQRAGEVGDHQRGGGDHLPGLLPGAQRFAGEGKGDPVKTGFVYNPSRQRQHHHVDRRAGDIDKALDGVHPVPEHHRLQQPHGGEAEPAQMRQAKEAGSGERRQRGPELQQHQHQRVGGEIGLNAVPREGDKPADHRRNIGPKDAERLTANDRVGHPRHLAGLRHQVSAQLNDANPHQQAQQHLPARKTKGKEARRHHVASHAMHVRHPERKDVVPAPVLVARRRQILIAKPWAVSSVGISGLNLMRILLIWHETCSCK